VSTAVGKWTDFYVQLGLQRDSPTANGGFSGGSLASGLSKVCVQTGFF
jgi:hypothetical protein